MTASGSRTKLDAKHRQTVQPPIEIQLTDGRNDCRICGIALLENNADLIKVTKLVAYVENQQRLDERLGWGMRWQTAPAK